MAETLESQRAVGEQVTFELETLELTAANRLEVTGRWFGVRGRRFVRPTLTFGGNGAASRALADLEHKPWTAEDGEPWTAAFPYDPDRSDEPHPSELELAVAPDIAITLAALGVPSSPRADVPPRREPPRPPATRSRPQPAELDAVRAQLQEARRRAADADAEVKAATARRDAAVSKLDAVIRERDEARAGRDEAYAGLHEARAGRDEARAERDTALGERDAALHQRDAALRQREKALRERDKALQEREKALERFSRLRATAQARLAQLQDQVRARRSVERSPASAPERQSDWRARGLALVVFTAFVIALLIVLQSP